MHFSTFTLKAGPEDMGSRQLVDLSDYATVRFAKRVFGAHGHVKGIEVTCSQPSAVKPLLVPRALYVVDSQLPHSGEEIEDVWSGSDGNGRRVKTPEGSTSVRPFVAVDGLLVFEAVV